MPLRVAEADGADESGERVELEFHAVFLIEEPPRCGIHA
jgi:hypothetical protein